MVCKSLGQRADPVERSGVGNQSSITTGSGSVRSARCIEREMQDGAGPLG